tara:strand:- start:5771 stop:5944 length:174 start_codon:yes stop_codon:yes gene_type:complete
MFKIFKKKTEVEKLSLKYKELLAEAHRLSTTSRRLSDEKAAEASEVLKQIEGLEKKK